MTPREAKKYLEDMRQAGALVQKLLEGRNFEALINEIALQPALEREFEIIGEAASRLLKQEPALEAELSDAKMAIAFRNRLARGYFSVDRKVLWDASTQDLPRLMQQVENAFKILDRN